MTFIWQDKKWPGFVYDASALSSVMTDAAFRHGRFMGELSKLGFDFKVEAGFEALSAEIIESAAIEGESLNRNDVRSSVAKRMDIVLKDGDNHNSHTVDARVEMMFDATRNWREPMGVKRLKAWHAATFTSGYSGLSQIRVGQFRNDSEGAMRVVSRHGMMERVHFVAPPARILTSEMRDFVAWMNKSSSMPALVKIAIAHLWFLTLHPFDDGNGRIARAVTEYMFSRMEQTELRFYSLSSQIQKEKAKYYDELEHAQRNTLDVTRWVNWFLGLHVRAVECGREMLSGILAKAEFWERNRDVGFSAHQKFMLNKLLDGFVGNMTSSKWAKMCKVSQDTASREIKSLVETGILVQLGAGRTTHYEIASR